MLEYSSFYDGPSQRVFEIFNTMLIFLYLLFKILPSSTNQICSTSPKLPVYHLIEKCYRSKLGILVKANYTSFISCQRFGIEKKGLAINFSPVEAKKEGVEYTCEILKCAEADGGLSLANDTAFDYYSLYGKPLPNANSSCVPGIGMFHLLPKRMNYTDVQTTCKSMSGVIPDVNSEQRTDALAQVLAGAGVEAVFVGLRRRNSSDFVGDTGDSLDCTSFRAWAPGHPRKNFFKHDCMLITKRRTWMSAPCKKQFPVFCELIPGGPYKRRSIFASKRRSENDTTIPANDVLNT